MSFDLSSFEPSPSVSCTCSLRTQCTSVSCLHSLKEQRTKGSLFGVVHVFAFVRGANLVRPQWYPRSNPSPQITNLHDVCVIYISIYTVLFRYTATSSITTHLQMKIFVTWKRVCFMLTHPFAKREPKETHWERGWHVLLSYHINPSIHII